MALVKFYRGLSTAYSAATYADGIYFATDTKEIILNGSKYGADSTQINDIVDKLADIEENAQVNVIESVSVDGTALTITNKGVNIELTKFLDDYTVSAENVEVTFTTEGAEGPEDTTIPLSEVITTIVDGIDSVNANSKLTLTSADGEDKTLKVYTLTQGTTEIGKINIPVDMVVSSGSVVEKEDGKKYIQLVIANQDDPLEIPVEDLVDVYTEGNGINITEGNVISIELDPATESFLEVTATGLKATGIQKAINDAVKVVDDKVTAVEDTIGESTDTASNTGSIYARIAQMKADIAALTGGESGSISDMIDSAKNTIDAYTVNGKKISENPVLKGSDITIGEMDTTTGGVIEDSDTVTAAVGKIVYNITWHEAE